MAVKMASLLLFNAAYFNIGGNTSLSYPYFIQLYTNTHIHTYCVTAADWVVGLVVVGLVVVALVVVGLGPSPCFFSFSLSLSLPFPLSLMASPSTGTLSALLQKTNVAVTNWMDSHRLSPDLTL